jgi:hypothetical protein
VQQALFAGQRGLPGGSTLAQLLAAKRGVRNPADPPRLTERRIVAWARAYRRRTGLWPSQHSGSVADAPRENWQAVNAALREGLRGLAGDDSVPRLLARRLGVRNQTNIPRLTKQQVLRWAREHRRRTGRWPTGHSGAVSGVEGETWANIRHAVRRGHRGLPGGETLAQLLRREAGDPNFGEG